MRLHNLARPALGILLLSALSIVSAARVADTYALRENHKVGDVASSKYVATLELKGAKVKIQGGSKTTIDEVKPDGSFVVSSIQSVEVYQDDKLLGKQADSPGKVTFTSNGQATAFDAVSTEMTPEGVTFSITRLSAFISPAAPVKMNEEWTIKYKEEKEKTMLPAVAKYKVVALEKLGEVPVAVVEMSYKETGDDDAPISSEGKHWVNIATGEVLKTVLTFKNFPTLQGIAKTGTIESEVVKS